MPRLIDADALMKKEIEDDFGVKHVLSSDVLDAPTIDAEPVRQYRNCMYCHNGKHRKIVCQPNGTYIRHVNFCDECGRDLRPNCGAKMQGDLDGTE